MLAEPRLWPGEYPGSDGLLLDSERSGGSSLDSDRQLIAARPINGGCHASGINIGSENSGGGRGVERSSRHSGETPNSKILHPKPGSNGRN
jgi:hypothetical protein